MLENETLVNIGKKYNKSPAQVCLRWGIQRNLVMLPKSVNPKRILENAQVKKYFIFNLIRYSSMLLFKVFDFTLSEQDMTDIKALNQNLRNYGVEVLVYLNLNFF